MLQGTYWWPTIVEDTSLFITLCNECGEKEEELPNEVDPTNTNTSKEIVLYKNKTVDWRTPLIEYIVHSKLNTDTQREQRTIICKSENFTVENGKLKKLEKDGTTKTCIAGFQIKR